MKNIDLFYDIAELTELFSESSGLNELLNNVADIVRRHMECNACSIYLYDEKQNVLSLSASRGIASGAGDEVPLSLDSSLIGEAFQELQSVRKKDSKSELNYRFDPGVNDPKMHAFLAVPIVRGLRPLGMLVIQDKQIDRFDSSDTRALRAISAQLASTIENTVSLLDLKNVATPDQIEIKEPSEKINYSGWPVLGNFSIGSILVFAQSKAGLFQKEIDSDTDQIDFEQAFLDTEQQIENMQHRVFEKDPDVAALIFSAHLLMLKDDGYAGEIRREIDAGVNPVEAVMHVSNGYIQLFSEMTDPHLREKSSDVKDLGQRLINNLTRKVDMQSDLSDNIAIVVDPLPSDILKLAVQNIAGLVLIGAGANSHTTLIARSLGITTILLDDLRAIDTPDGASALLDAELGVLYIEPSKVFVERYRSRKAVTERTYPPKGEKLGQVCTADGVRMRLMANINLLSELRSARRAGAEGVGLYRTEFPFLLRNNFPSEEEQYRIYRTIVEEMDGKEVTFRTLDVGGDKLLDYFSPSAREDNPFLGLRAIRFSLRHTDIFRTQIRALLRSGAGNGLRILFPLIASIDDYRAAKSLVIKYIAELDSEGIAHNGDPMFGAMIELPAIVETLTELAREVDFLSIGSNDLIQYQLAVDRSNTTVADLYRPHHPAVLRVMERIVRKARSEGVEISLCGEMATHILLVPFLVGIGLETFSVAPDRLYELNTQLTGIDSKAAKIFAEELLAMATIREVEERLGLPLTNY